MFARGSSPTSGVKELPVGTMDLERKDLSRLEHRSLASQPLKMKDGPGSAGASSQRMESRRRESNLSMCRSRIVFLAVVATSGSDRIGTMSASAPIAETGGVFSGFTRLSKGLAAVLVTGYLANAVFPHAVSDTFSLVPGSNESEAKAPQIWLS